MSEAKPIYATKNEILDARLKPTTKRSRTGQRQIFRNENEPFFELRHTKKSMYAELINKKWYWVEGCPECRGEKRSSITYIECETHDVCKDCKTKRADLKEIPWGSPYGFQCVPCHSKEKAERKRAAIEKLDGQKPYTKNTDCIICPCCGSVICSDDIHEPCTVECDICDSEMELEVEYLPSYSTKLIN